MKVIQLKLLNFGSLNIDYVYSLDHLVLPGETISSNRRDVFCGGKGLNQSIAFAKAGAKVYHAGKVGQDGKLLLDVLERHGVDCSYVQTIEGASGHTIIQVDRKGENSIILYGGANRMITPEDVTEVLSHFTAGDVVVLQNEISSLKEIILQAHDKGMKIIFNPAPFEQELLEYPLEYIDLLIVNEVEGGQCSGKTEPKEILTTLYNRYHTAVLLTLGKEGAMYYDGDDMESHPIYPSNVVDTTAAGDTFTGYFSSALLTGSTPKQALELASKASSITVSRSGAADSIPYYAEIQEQFGE